MFHLPSSFLLFALAASTFFPSIHAIQTFQVLAPPELANYTEWNRIRERNETGIEHRPAMFGRPPYGRTLYANLYAPTQPRNQLGCDPFDLSNEPKWPRSVDPDDLQPGEVPSIYVLLLQRGGCSFVQKVRNAQNIGAAVVIIMNRVGENQLYYMADDGTGASVVIPSIFIKYDDGKVLNDSLVAGKNITLAMSWSLHAVDDLVKWDLWTSSRDPDSFSFKQTFGAVERALGNSTLFTPHYQFHTSNWRVSWNPYCMNVGRYCAPDPDGFGDGLTGRDVVKENLRQICLYRELLAHNTTDTWWDYVSIFEIECSSPSQWQTSDCGDNIIRRLGQNLDEVNACINLAPLSPTSDVEHPIIKAELQAFQLAGIFALPSVIINEEPYHGTIPCPEPLSLETCGILAAICSAFTNGTEPDVCHPNGCFLGVQRDCADKCGGGAEIDACGICLSPQSPAFQRGTCISITNTTFPPPIIINNGSTITIPTYPPIPPPVIINNGTTIINNNGTTITEKIENTTSGASVGAVIGIVIGGIVIIAIIIVLYMKRQKKELHQGMDSMLRQYLPMEDNDGINGHDRDNTRHL